MVSQCPSYSQLDTRACQESEDEPPVTSVVGGYNKLYNNNNQSVVYKNVHCARCNGVTHVIPWDISVICPFYSNTPLNSLHNSLLTSFVQKGCDVVYSPPENSSYRQCYNGPNTISKCNATGQWRKYNAFYGRACESYSMPKLADGKIYKNVFCYLCNKKDVSFDPRLDKCREDPFQAKTAFEARVDLKQLGVAETSNSYLQVTGYEICGQHGLYDLEEGICRQVSCAFGQRLNVSSGLCQPAFINVKGLTYELYFKLKPNGPMYLSEEYDYIHRLPSELEIALRQGLRENNVEIEDLSIAFNSTMDGGRCSHSTISDLSLYARIKCTKLTNQTRLQQRLLSVKYEAVRLVNQRWNNVTMQSIPRWIPWHPLHPSRGYYSHSSPHCVTIVSKNVVKRRQDGIIRVGTTTPDPATIHARRMSPPVVRVSKLLTCPHVRLLPSEYTVITVHEAGEDLLVSWQDQSLLADEYVVNSDGTVAVCLSTFLGKLNKNNQGRTSTETLCAMILLPLSCVLLLICLVVHLSFPALRSLPRKNNVIVILCLSLSQVAIWIGYNVPYYSDWCTVMGILCHYFSLCLFLSLSVSSYHLYTVFSTMHLSVDITRENRTFSRYSCFIFTLPIVVVSVVIIIYKSSDRLHSTTGYGSVALCFLTFQTAMWIANFIPLVIFVVVSLVLFLLTYSALQSNADLETNVTDERHVHFYFRSSVFVVFTWTLGAIALETRLPAMRIAFVVAQFCLSLYIFFTLVANRNVASLVASTCFYGSSTARNKDATTILRLGRVKHKDSQTNQASVITTGYKQKDSPKSCGKSIDGDSMDNIVSGSEDEGCSTRVINDGYSTIETVA